MRNYGSSSLRRLSTNSVGFGHITHKLGLRKLYEETNVEQNLDQNLVLQFICQKFADGQQESVYLIPSNFTV